MTISRPTRSFSRLAALVLSALLALALAPAAAQTPSPPPVAPPSTRSGTCFRIVGHGAWPRGALAAALEAAQAAARPAARIYGSRPGGDVFPRDIHLYRDPADFVCREGEITGGRFRHALAFSAFVFRNAHVALQPPLDPEVLEAAGLPRMTCRQIAHEAAHLYCFAVAPAFRDHPSWYSEGAAMWIADRVMRERGLSAGIDGDPVTATRIGIVQGMRASGRAPQLVQVIRNAVHGLASDERYAVEWAVFAFLMQGERRHPFEAALARARRMPPGRDFADRLAARVIEAFGADAMQDLDRAFGRWLAGFEPAWDEEAPALEVRGPRWTQIAFPDAPAAAWRTEAVEGKRIVFRGRLTFLPGHGASAGLLFGSGPDGHLAVTITPDATVLRAFERNTKRWVEIGRARFDPRPAGASIRFQVAVDRDEARIRVGGEERLRRSLGRRSAHGRWGVAVDEGTAVVWDRVRVRTAP